MPFFRSSRSTRSYHDCKQFCRSSSICGSFFAMIWCINMLVSAVTSLSYVSEYFDEWIEAEAMIIGRNVTIHYRNSNATTRRHLLGTSNIPNFTAEDGFNETTDIFDGNLTNGTNNNTWPDDGNGGLVGDLDSWNDNNTTDQDVPNNGTATNNDSQDDEDSEQPPPIVIDNPTLVPGTPTLPPVKDGGRLVYCAEVRFDVNENLTITAVSDTYCSYDPDDIVVGRVFGILYNPDLPTEIIEESLYNHAKNTLRLTVGVTIFFTVGYLLCSIYLWRSQPDFTRGMFPQHDLDFGDVHTNTETAQTPEEREALMKSKFYFQTVLEDLSNTNAASIRRLCNEKEGETVMPCMTGQCACNNRTNQERNVEQNGRLEDVDLEAQDEKLDPLEPMEEEEYLDLDLSKKENSKDEVISTSNTETETDTDAGSNNQGSAANETSDDDDDNAKQRPQQQPESSQQPEPTWSLAGATNLISSWTNDLLAPSAPECCICLETYQPGDKICISRSEGCDHVFHQQCIEAWLHRHDACPLCRIDLMNTTTTTSNSEA